MRKNKQEKNNDRDRPNKREITNVNTQMIIEGISAGEEENEREWINDKERTNKNEGNRINVKERRKNIENE